MPAYMEQFSQYPSITKAVRALCWNKHGLYHKEVYSLLKQELRTPNIYFAILKALAFGETRISKIASKTNLTVQLVNKYIDTLERLQFVKREVPVTEDKPHKSKKGLYFITENFTRFWFQYIFTFSSDIEIGNIEQARSRFRKNSNILEATTYEEVARQHLYALQQKLFPIQKLGREWNKDVEIDGIGINNNTKQIVFMEAKWTNTKLGIRDLTKLKTKSQYIPWNIDNRTEYYALYAKSGFKKDIIEYSKENHNIRLIEGIELLYS